MSTGLLGGAPGSAVAQGSLLDPGKALQDFLSRSAAKRSEAPPLSAVLPALGSPSQAHDFALVGVVIAGEQQLAVLEDAAGAQLLPVGGSLAGYRIIDVQADRVTLEGDGGRRMTIRLGASALAPSDQPSEEGREPARAAANPDLTQDKQRQAAIAVEAALDKAARGEGTPAPGSPETRPALGK